MSDKTTYYREKREIELKNIIKTIKKDKERNK